MYLRLFFYIDRFLTLQVAFDHNAILWGELTAPPRRTPLEFFDHLVLGL